MKGFITTDKHAEEIRSVYGDEFLTFCKSQPANATFLGTLAQFEQEENKMSNEGKKLFVDGFNYSCCYFNGEFMTHPSSGGLNPFRERFESFEEASIATGISEAKLKRLWDRKSGTITDKGKLISSDTKYGQWRFEVTYAQ